MFATLNQTAEKGKKKKKHIAIKAWYREQRGWRRTMKKAPESQDACKIESSFYALTTVTNIDEMASGLVAMVFTYTVAKGPAIGADPLPRYVKLHMAPAREVPTLAALQASNYGREMQRSESDPDQYHMELSLPEGLYYYIFNIDGVLWRYAERIHRTCCRSGNTKDSRSAGTPKSRSTPRLAAPAQSTTAAWPSHASPPLVSSIDHVE
jgi:hypothetical protein